MPNLGCRTRECLPLVAPALPRVIVDKLQRGLGRPASTADSPVSLSPVTALAPSASWRTLREPRLCRSCCAWTRSTTEVRRRAARSTAMSCDRTPVHSRTLPTRHPRPRHHLVERVLAHPSCLKSLETFACPHTTTPRTARRASLSGHTSPARPRTSWFTSSPHGRHRPRRLGPDAVKRVWSTLDDILLRYPSGGWRISATTLAEHDLTRRDARLTHYPSTTPRPRRPWACVTTCARSLVTRWR